MQVQGHMTGAADTIAQALRGTGKKDSRPSGAGASPTLTQTHVYTRTHAHAPCASLQVVLQALGHILQLTLVHHVLLL